MQEMLPILMLKKIVLLPHEEVRLEINNDISKIALDDANKNHNNKILVISPLNTLEENPSPNDLPNIGVIGKIKTKIKLPNGNYRIAITGLNRVQVIKYITDKETNTLKSLVKRIYVNNSNEVEDTALYRKLMELLEKYISISPEAGNSIMSLVNSIEDLDKVTDLITSFVPLGIGKKLAYMNEFDYVLRAKELVKDINIELEIIELNERIEKEIRDNFETEQKEIVLKEKINKINEELGISSNKQSEISEFRKLLAELNISKKTKQKLESEIRRYEYTNENNPDSSVIRNYLDWTLNLPWNTSSKEETNITKVEKTLNESHYGLNEIKMRILEYISIKKLNKEVSSPIICLVGPSGVGKTSLAVSISESLKREFVKISVGGLNDSGELIGHRKTFLGANPGKIIQGIRKIGVNNPVILIDEVDKMVKDYKGDPASTLLDILDPKQNKYFVDNYIEEPFNLSNCFFILTANNLLDIPDALRDRLEVIEINSYTEYEKVAIAKNYILKNICISYGIKNIKVTDEVLLELITSYTKEAGVRELERLLKRLVRNIIINDKKKVIDADLLIEVLGNKKYELTNINNHIGLINALACTKVGGIVLPLETIIYSGKEEIIITGNIKDLMKESVQVALTYIKSTDYTNYNFEGKTIHFNALNSAIPKDGTSGGVAITSSILSVLLNKEIPKFIAFTGEISLYGEILPVGGIKEKIIAGFNNGIKKVFIPKQNEKDLETIDKTILDNMEIIFVNNYQEIYKSLFKK